MMRAFESNVFHGYVTESGIRISVRKEVTEYNAQTQSKVLSDCIFFNDTAVLKLGDGTLKDFVESNFEVVECHLSKKLTKRLKS